MATDPRRLVVIGGGHMGAAIVHAACRGSAAAGGIVVADPDAGRRASLERDCGEAVRTVASACESVAAGGAGAMVILAVKPQVFTGVAGELKDAAVLREQLIVSIMAGVRTGTIDERLGARPTSLWRVARAMPNLPLACGEGMTAVCPGPRVTPEDLDAVVALFSLGGKVVRIGEDLFDAFTALAGSGPAYVLYLAEAMERAAVDMGFSPVEARTIVRQTITGAAALQRDEPGSADAAGLGALSPAEFRARVTSRGGTTEAAIRVLDEAGVMETIVRAILAGRDRGRQLGD